MEYRSLGRTGVQVSPLCLGAMMLGPWGNNDTADSIRIIHRAIDAGINFIDTADVYSGGASEEIVGQALQGHRDEVFLATKFFMPMSEDPNQRGGSRRWIMQEVENSLRRLNTDHIDLYQVHRPSPDTDVEETLGALTDLVRQGKVRYIGSSSTRDPRSSKPSGLPGNATWNGSSRNSRPTRSWSAASKKTFSPRSNATAWARSPTARSAEGGFQGAGVKTQLPHPPPPHVRTPAST